MPIKDERTHGTCGSYDHHWQYQCRKKGYDTVCETGELEYSYALSRVYFTMPIKLFATKAFRYQNHATIVSFSIDLSNQQPWYHFCTGMWERVHCEGVWAKHAVEVWSTHAIREKHTQRSVGHDREHVATIPTQHYWSVWSIKQMYMGHRSHGWGTLLTVHIAQWGSS